MKSLSRAQLFATPWTGAYQAPRSMGFSRQEYWSGVPLPSPIFSSTTVQKHDFFGAQPSLEMAPHSSILAWRIPGTEQPSGLPSMGSHRVGHDRSDLAAAVAAAEPIIYFNIQKKCFLHTSQVDRQKSQFHSVAQLCSTLCNPMDCSTPGLPVHHQLPEFTQTHVH